jgi:hypothetical protein
VSRVAPARVNLGDPWQGFAIPEPDHPDVSANSIVMAAHRGGHPEEHKTFGWPVKPRPDVGAKIRQCFQGLSHLNYAFNA